LIVVNIVWPHSTIKPSLVASGPSRHEQESDMSVKKMERMASAVPPVRAAAMVAAALTLLAAGPAQAQLPIPASSQFDLTGFIQVATLDAACAASAHCGGTMVLNGHTVIIPKETIVILPASAFTWQELFTQAPLPYKGVATGMALTDLPAPLTTYEAHVTGNRVLGVTDTYIAGLVHISQQDLNSGAGFINFMDYTTGEMRVGGVLGDPTTGARVRLNDPVGRFGRIMSPDARFSVDDANPTIAAGTGFPMCFPRVAPSGVVGGPETDPLCPQANRPGPSIINMADPALGIFPNPNFQVPMQVGDYVTFAGTLVTDRATPTTGPVPNAVTEPGVGTYVSAHTITSNVAVFTAPGTNPAYVSVEVSLIGTGGLTVIGAGEAVIRTRFEGMTTDPSRNVHIYGIDLNALTGATTDRDWGTIGVDPGPPNGAVKGRWRFRPPCTVVVPTDKACTPPAAGVFLPPTREMRAVIEGQQSQNPGLPGALTAANGIFYGQYHAPINEYIFPENIPGTPIVENNFNTIAFLAQGGYASALGTLVGQLNPWPSNIVPTPACLVPVAAAGGPYTVASGGTVTLLGSATGTAPLTFAWAPPAAGTLSNAAIANPVFTAPVTPGAIPLSLTVTNACGTSSSATTVTVNAAAAPTVNHVAPITVLAGTPAVTIPISGVDPGGLALTFTATQAGAPALTTFRVNRVSNTSATITFGVPALPIGQVLPSVINLTITATNAGGAVSASEFTTVTIRPVADSVVVTNVTYRTSKQRLVITATSSVVSTNVVLNLRPYVTFNGSTFDPVALGSTFANNGGGLYTLTLVGAPEPALPPALPIVVQSNLGGVSAAHGVDLVRQ
jgi:hypothetical protein